MFQGQEALDGMLRPETSGQRQGRDRRQRPPWPALPSRVHPSKRLACSALQQRAPSAGLACPGLRPWHPPTTTHL